MGVAREAGGEGGVTDGLAARAAAARRAFIGGGGGRTQAGGAKGCGLCTGNKGCGARPPINTRAAAIAGAGADRAAMAPAPPRSAVTLTMTAIPTPMIVKTLFRWRPIASKVHRRPGTQPQPAGRAGNSEPGPLSGPLEQVMQQRR